MTNSNILIYQSEDGQTRIQTRLEDETVWLTIEQMSELFQKSRSTINEHILNIYKEEELEKEFSLRKIGNSDFSTKPTNFYNLSLIISVGYRVKSPQGTKFRQWATGRLEEYIVKGFTMNDELLKEVGGGSYFEELLSRIRDIRSSEKVFWRKVLDIYSTSIDYDSKAKTSILFFQTIQNKMHWAAHGNTAAAEIQAMNQTPMYMKDWIDRIDDFLKMTGKDILTHAGTISHNQAMQKASVEYERYKEQIKNSLSNVEKDFIRTIDTTAKKLK